MLPRIMNEEEIDRIFEEKLFISKRATEKSQEVRSSTSPSNYIGNNNVNRKMVNAIMDESTDYNYGEAGKEFTGRIDLRGMSYDYDTDRITTENKLPSTVTFSELSEEDVSLGSGKATQECEEKLVKEPKLHLYEENAVLSESKGGSSHTEMSKNKTRKAPLREIDSNVVSSERKWKGRNDDSGLKSTTISSMSLTKPEDERKTEPVPIPCKKIAEDLMPGSVNKAHSLDGDFEQRSEDDRGWGKSSGEERSAGNYCPALLNNVRDEAEQEKQLLRRTEPGRRKVVVIDDVPEVRFLDKSSDSANVKSEHICKIEEEFDKFRRVHIESLKFKSKIYRFIYQELYKMEENMGQRLSELEKENAQLKERIMYLEDHHRRFREFVSKGARIWKEQVIEGIREYKKRLDEEYERRVSAAENVLRQRRESG